jgi:hypothetical protein
MQRIHRLFFSLCAFALLAAGIAGCATTQIYHGFSDETALNRADNYVMSESLGGKLDPQNLAQEDQRYTHGDIAYNRMEEGYYQWGAKLYEMGYRDVFYVRDLAPKAFHRELIDTYDHAIEQGFKDAGAK